MPQVDQRPVKRDYASYPQTLLYAPWLADRTYNPHHIDPINPEKLFATIYTHHYTSEQYAISKTRQTATLSSPSDRNCIARKHICGHDAHISCQVQVVFSPNAHLVRRIDLKQHNRWIMARRTKHDEVCVDTCDEYALKRGNRDNIRCMLLVRALLGEIRVNLHKPMGDAAE